MKSKQTPSDWVEALLVNNYPPLEFNELNGDNWLLSMLDLKTDEKIKAENYVQPDAEKFGDIPICRKFR